MELVEEDMRSDVDFKPPDRLRFTAPTLEYINPRDVGRKVDVVTVAENQRATGRVESLIARRSKCCVVCG